MIEQRDDLIIQIIVCSIDGISVPVSSWSSQVIILELRYNEWYGHHIIRTILTSDMRNLTYG